MFRRLIAKGNLRRSDSFRVLVTDTSPGDVPLIFSNDGFYNNIRNLERLSPPIRQIVEQLIIKRRPFTIPYRYSILRPGRRYRNLSLTHPHSQYEVSLFYKKYAELICHFARQSPASIRSPEKVGSTFFIREHARAACGMKGEEVETVELENATSNPASYFAYRGHPRLHKFFESNDYMRLEKRFSQMASADIAGCFDRIYTHTLPWALSGQSAAKENTQARNLANDFDQLMQSQNYRETNGICIGAEVSRVFAELLLGAVDISTIRLLTKKGLHYRSHYEFVRYVDDYFIFAQDERIILSILSALEASLKQFKLTLNHDKTIKHGRPFVTTKSRMVRAASDHLETFLKLFLEYKAIGDAKCLIPKPIRRSDSLVRSFIESVKSSCIDSKSGYESVSNYIISALNARIGILVSGYELVAADKGNSLNAVYLNAIMVLLETIYFYFNVDPTVPSSYRTAQAAIQSIRFVKDKMPEHRRYVEEQVVRWTHHFTRTFQFAALDDTDRCIPLEALNAISVLGEVMPGDTLSGDAIADICGPIESLGYFEIVSLLQCIKDDDDLAALRGQIIGRAVALIKSSRSLATDAEGAHLSLDLLSCPYVSDDVRIDVLRYIRNETGLGQIDDATALKAVHSSEKNPWFVNWKQTDLLLLLRKKELSSVY